MATRTDVGPMTHAAEALFRQHLPARTQATDDFSRGVQWLPLEQALRRRYIRPSPPGLRTMLVFDLDHDDPLRWEYANLPAPNMTVMNRGNGRSHIAYYIEHPVRVSRRRRPSQLFKAIENSFQVRLRADMAYCGTFLKNPCSREYRVIWGTPSAYTLTELHEWCPEASKYQPPARVNRVLVGSANCVVFREVAAWAYRNVLDRQRAGMSLPDWQDELAERALQVGGGLGFSDFVQLGNSIGAWTWSHFTLDDFREMQVERGRASGRARYVGSKAERRPWEAQGISRATYFRRKRRARSDRETRTISGYLGVRGLPLGLGYAGVGHGKLLVKLRLERRRKGE